MSNDDYVLFDRALGEMIQAKSKGGKGLVDAAKPKNADVIDLKAALMNSLKGATEPAAKKTASKEPASKTKSAA